MSSVHTNLLPFTGENNTPSVAPEVRAASEAPKAVVSKIPITMELSPEQLNAIATALAA
jgi:hypothetical protein